MADVIVKPGGSWSGNIYLAEIPSAENREKMDELEIQFGKESRRRSARLQSLAVNALEKISNGSIKDALNTAALGGINLTNCSAPPKELSDLATQLTQQGLFRLSKGSYQVKLEISDVEKVLSKRNRQAILFERHLRILQDEDSLASNICASLASNYTTNFKLPASGIQIEYSRISLASK